MQVVQIQKQIKVQVTASDTGTGTDTTTNAVQKCCLVVIEGQFEIGKRRESGSASAGVLHLLFYFSPAGDLAPVEECHRNGPERSLSDGKGEKTRERKGEGCAH